MLYRVCDLFILRQTFLDGIRNGGGKMAHSRTAGDYFGVAPMTVRRWVKEFCEDDKFIARGRQYDKLQQHSYIDDENIRERLREFIDRRLYRRKKGEPRLRVGDVQK